MSRLKSVFVLVPIIVGAVFACRPEKPDGEKKRDKQQWDEIRLKDRAATNQDSAQWNKALLKQDLETYHSYAELFEAYPLSNYPFPVADYDYAVYSNPFTLKTDSKIFKGVQVGAYHSPEGDKIDTKLVLIILTNDEKLEPETFVDSRNFPYLTAEGNFFLPQHQFKWVFQASPDGFSTLFFSMKLFDLRFGQTVIIYPQQDQSFRYKQIEESPNNYANFDRYLKRIKEKHLK